MQVIRDREALVEALAALRAEGARVALVPTMGALHAGHIALVEAAKRPGTKVVASIFVNPKQFGAGEDLGRYPRREQSDIRMLTEAGCDLLWMPGVEVMYPVGHATSIRVDGVSEGLEGRRAPAISTESPRSSPSSSTRSAPMPPISARRISSSWR